MLKQAGFSSWEIWPDGGDWDQVLLSVNLQFTRLCFLPLVILVNCAGIVLECIDHRETNPANYTIIARA